MLNKHIHPLELVTQNIIVIWILLFSNSSRFFEQSFIISSLIPVRKVPYHISIWNSTSAYSFTNVDSL